MPNKLAIVTGASTGIGFELASLAAKDGYDIVVVADEPLIEAAAQDFKQFGTEVTSVEADLSTLEGVDKLLAATGGRPVDVLCANAGKGLGHAFLEQSVEDWRRVVDTNITGTIYLLQKVLKEMVARNEGKVLVTGSIAGYLPGSYQAVYNSSKSFVDFFTDALRDELKDVDGVTITTLKPGPVNTEFFARGDMLDTSVGDPESDSRRDPALVAKDGWDAMNRGDDSIFSGLSVKVQGMLANILPARLLATMHRNMAEPGTAKG